AIGDAFLYLEKDGRRTVTMHNLEIPRVREDAPELEIMPTTELGEDELYAAGKQAPEIELEIIRRACAELGIERATVPATFPLEVADFLRANGVGVTADRELFESRRRSKNEIELRGVRNAQKACEAALDRAREMLRGATTANGGRLELEGEPLTSERIKQAIESVFSDFECEG